MKRTLLILLSFWIVGCGQDPYADMNGLSDSPQGKKENKQPFENPHEPVLLIDSPAYFSFVEGAESKHHFYIQVPETGTPVITFKNLPQGLVFDAKGVSLTWTPALGLGQDPTDPFANFRTYPLTIQLSSTEMPHRTVEKEVSLLVYKRSNTLSVKLFNTIYYLYEGESRTFSFEIQDAEHPNGPFDIQLNGFPQGTTLRRDPANPSHNYIDMVIGYSVLKGSEYSKPFQGEVFVISPSGARAAPSFSFTVYSRNQYPIVSFPSSIYQGPNVSFLLTAQDPNEDAPPTIQLYSTPGFGKPELVLLSAHERKSSLPTAHYEFHWSGIPNSYAGKSYLVKFKACSTSGYCKYFDTKVNFTFSNPPGPAIDRSAWVAGELRYFRLGEETRLALPITNVESVDVGPTEMQSEVRWEAGELILTPTQQGVKQFTLNARSNLGAITLEGFSMEVLPADWDRVLLLVNSVGSPESQKLKSLFEGGNLVNPIWQPLDARMLALREVLVAGTEILGQASAITHLETASSKVKKVFINSPLAGRLTGTLRDEIEANGVNFSGRFLSLSALPLSQFSVLPDTLSGLSAPTSSVSLLEQLTSESPNPNLLNLTSNSACVPLLNLEESSAPTSFLSAVRCPRANGGRLVISGMEFGDLSSEETAKIWLKESLDL